MNFNEEIDDIYIFDDRIINVDEEIDDDGEISDPDFPDEEILEMERYSKREDIMLLTSDWNFGRITDKFESREAVPMRIPSLKEIAYVHIVAALWNHINILLTISQKDRWHGAEIALHYEVVKSAQALLIPKSIFGRLKECIDEMRNEIRLWLSYHRQQVFFNQETMTCWLKYIHYIVWYPNGVINYIQTARNLVKSTKLTRAEEYNILCTYCMKDDIERILPLCSNILYDVMNFSHFPLISYWNCFFRKQLNSVPLDDDVSIDYFMVRHDLVNNWFAKQYFFDRLSSDEQVQVAEWMIDHNSTKYQKLITMRLNEEQRRNVYKNKNEVVLNNYLRTEVHYDDNLTTWSDIRNVITQSQLSTIFRVIMNVQADIKEAHLYPYKLKPTVLPHIITRISNDVWAIASDNFKKDILNHGRSIELILDVWTIHKDNDFFFTVILDADENWKKKLTEMSYFPENCLYLIRRNDFNSLNRLLNSLLGSVENSELFKRNLSRSETFKNWCLRIIQDRLTDDFPELEGALKSLILDTDELLEFKRELSNSKAFHKRFMEFLNRKEFQQFEQLLNVYLPNPEESAQFKRNLTKEKLYREMCCKLLSYGKVKTSEQLLSVCISDQQELLQFKRDFAKDLFNGKMIQSWGKRYVSEMQQAVKKWFSQYPQEIEQIIQNTK